MNEPRAVTILLVEDEDLEIEAVRRALHKARIANPVRVAHDGVEALQVLRGENGREPLEHPFLILLDINMPRMNGLEFLAALRADPKLRPAVVFVLTTSEEDEDRLRAYEKNVAGYIVKGHVGQDFHRVAELVGTYWKVVAFPPDPLEM